MMTGKRPELGRYCLERVTRIELALSAWESDRSGLLTALTWTSDAPLVTVMDLVTPGLMARQWPVARWLWRRLGCRRASPSLPRQGVWFSVWGGPSAGFAARCRR
jgi:hypothetical protein